MDLTSTQKDLLKNLARLMNYGRTQMVEKLVIDPKKWTRMTLRRKLLFYMFGATQSLAESILKVIRPTEGHPSIYRNSALLLFRSLSENLINISWIYACRGQKNAAIFAIDEFQSKKTYANEYRELMRKYSKTKFTKWNLTFGNIREANDWDKFISTVEKSIKEAQKKYNLPEDSELPNLKQRCVQFDIYLKTKNKLKQKNSLERFYVLYYDYFSGIAHLKAQGLNAFRDKLDDPSPSIDSDPKEIEKLVPLIYTVYRALLEVFLKRFGAYDKVQMREYRTIERYMLKQRQQTT